MDAGSLRVAVAGLGRMGKIHAYNLRTKTARADLVAVFAPQENEQQWARQHLGPHITIYNDYDELLRHQDLQAVVIATITPVHAEQAVKALRKNLHLLCEKPLSNCFELSAQVAEEASRRPHLRAFCAFPRRFDTAYRNAQTKVQQGIIGEPVIIRHQLCDLLDPSPFFMAYAEHSPGIFVDMCIHDIDMTFFLLGEDIEPKSISAHGLVAIHKGVEKYQDVDNAFGIVEFWNGKIAQYYCSRTSFAGQEDGAEIIGTQGKIVVSGVQDNTVSIYTGVGVSRDIPLHWYDRFEEAFVREANEFTDFCLGELSSPIRFMKLSNAARAVKIGVHLQEALRSGKRLEFERNGHVVSTSDH